MYKKLIVTFTGCLPEDADTIEDWMRAEVNTLDNLSREQFRKLSRDVHKSLLWARSPDGQAFIASLKKEFE